ncbi:MAG: hypothetical protein KF814_00790 [Nitrospiraceae bacterium]|nr:hypothetical protein [Nitrospiraceae bacterium]
MMSPLHDHPTSLDRPPSFDSQIDHDDCRRCGGFLVAEPCLDFYNDGGACRCEVRRCVQCGDVVDDVILRNRCRVQSADAAPDLVMVGAEG